MRIASCLLLVMALAGCSAGAQKRQDTAGSTPGLFASLPRPSDLQAAVPHSTSIAPHPVTRTAIATGDQFPSFPGYSDNVVPDAGDSLAYFTGQTTALTYALYDLNSFVLNDTQQITQMRIDYEWDATPLAGHGFFVGLPDHTNNRWIWFSGESMRTQWLDVSGLNLNGVAAGAPFPASYIAVVNFSTRIGVVHSITTRFEDPATVHGDEWLYYTSRVPTESPFINSVSRVSITGGTPELIHEGTGTDSYGYPFVVPQGTGWRIIYGHQSAASPVVVDISDLDGSSPSNVITQTENIYPGGWSPLGSRALFTPYNPVDTTTNLYAANNVTADYGRLSRSNDIIGKVVWDLSIDESSGTYGAICSWTLDTFNPNHVLVRFNGAPPFPIDATPSALFLHDPDQDYLEPDMVHLISWRGDPHFYIYFAAAKPTDLVDPSYHLVRCDYSTLTVESVLVDPGYDFHFPAVSPDGRYLAYLRRAIPALPSDPYELVVSDLYDPGDATVLASNATRQVSWYDPTP